MGSGGIFCEISPKGYRRIVNLNRAHMGCELRAEFVFEGTSEFLVEIELDETVVRKVKSYDGQGRRTGTSHHAVFSMRQRGSKKTVLYVMQPRWVPIVCFLVVMSELFLHMANPCPPPPPHGT